MENEALPAVTRNLFIELVICSALVLGYSVVVLPWLSGPLRQLFHGNSLVYALLSLGLIVAHGSLLDRVTAFLLDQLPVERLE